MLLNFSPSSLNLIWLDYGRWHEHGTYLEKKTLIKKSYNCKLQPLEVLVWCRSSVVRQQYLVWNQVSEAAWSPKFCSEYSPKKQRSARRTWQEEPTVVAWRSVFDIKELHCKPEPYVSAWLLEARSCSHSHLLKCFFSASTACFCIIERLLINVFYSALKLGRYLLIKLTLNYFLGLMAVVGMRTDQLHSIYRPT